MLDKFHQPSTFLLCGPTGSGKTRFVVRLILEKMFRPMPTNIVWIYSVWQQIYTDLKLQRPDVQFEEDLTEEIYNSFTTATQNLIILDDQMTKLGSSPFLSKVFTEGSHHLNLSVLYIVQNLYHKADAHREASRNSQYLILFKTMRGFDQIERLARNMFTKKTGAEYYLDAYKDATDPPYGYLVTDTRIDTPSNEPRVLTKIFPNEGAIFYLTMDMKPKKGIKGTESDQDGGNIFLLPMN